MSTTRDRHGQQARHVDLGLWCRKRSATPDTAPPAALVSFAQSVAYGIAASAGVTALLFLGLLWRW